MAGEERGRGGATSSSSRAQPPVAGASTSAAPSSTSNTGSGGVLATMRRYTPSVPSVKLPFSASGRQSRRNSHQAAESAAAGDEANSASSSKGHSPRSGSPRRRSLENEPVVLSTRPPGYRENTALHALMDSLPTLPTLHAPSMPSLPSLSRSSAVASMLPGLPASLTSCSPFSSSTAAAYDDEDDDEEDDADDDEDADDAEGASASRRASHGREEGEEAPSGVSTPERKHSTSSSSAGQAADKSTRNGSAAAQTDPLKTLSGNVVVLGGYRGSILRDAKTGRRVWLPLRVGFNFRKADLSMGLSDQAELSSTDKIVPGRMLMQVAGIVDLGKRLKDKLKARDHASASASSQQDAGPPLRFHNHGYDWRRNLDLSAKELLEKLELLKRESAERGEGPDGQGEGATVIAHSMGGLVVLGALAMAQDPTVFKGVIFAGTPFHGCINVLGPLRRGDRTMFNAEVCAPSVVFSMRSSFYFLPEDGKCFEREDGTPLPIDFFNPHSWSEHCLSPLAADLLGPECASKQVRRLVHRTSAVTAEDLGVRLPPPEPESDPEHERLSGAKEERARRAVASASSSPRSTSPPRRVSGVQVRTTQRSPSARRTLKRKSKSLSSEAQEAEKQQAEQLPSDIEIEAYLARTLDRVKRYRQMILESFDETKAYPPIALLTSRKTPTVRGAIADSYEELRDTQYDRLRFADGDGIVLHASSSSLPGPWNKLVRGVKESTFGHVSLVGDLDSIRACLRMLYE